MPSNRLNVYPDSDFWFDDLVSTFPSVIDLSAVKVYRVNGEEMVKLSDLQKLNIPIKSREVEDIEFPQAA